jgi:hypothetical protein
VGPGKTFILVMLAINFFLCYGDEDPAYHPQGAAVSITKENLRDNFWKELAVWYAKSPILQKIFDLNSEKFFHRKHPKTWFLSARAFPRRANKEQMRATLSGLHSRNIVFLMDETGQMPVEILQTAEQALSNCEFGKIVQAGNPMAVGPEWMLHTCYTKLLANSTNKGGWYFVTVNNDPDKPRRSVLPNWEKTLAWCRQMVKDWGRDNPWVKYAVFGEFPPSNFNSLISLEQVEQAIARELQPSAYHFMQKRYGLDVAFEGGDLSVLAPNQGLMYYDVDKIALDKTSRTFSLDIAARVLEKTKVIPPEVIYVDATGGYGDGVISAINQHRFFNAVGVQFSSSASNPAYYNKRTEMWFELCKAIKNGAKLPENCPEIGTGLSTATYTLKNGLYLLEPKDIMKTRLGRSPDVEDALALNHAQPLCPAADRREEFRRPRRERTDDSYKNPARGITPPRPGYKNPSR